jgi:hypothetical protein
MHFRRQNRVYLSWTVYALPVFNHHLQQPYAFRHWQQVSPQRSALAMARPPALDDTESCAAMLSPAAVLSWELCSDASTAAVLLSHCVTPSYTTPTGARTWTEQDRCSVRRWEVRATIRPRRRRPSRVLRPDARHLVSATRGSLECEASADEWRRRCCRLPVAKQVQMSSALLN